MSEKIKEIQEKLDTSDIDKDLWFDYREEVLSLILENERLKQENERLKQENEKLKERVAYLERSNECRKKAIEYIGNGNLGVPRNTRNKFIKILKGSDKE